MKKSGEKAAKTAIDATKKKIAEENAKKTRTLVRNTNSNNNKKYPLDNKYSESKKVPFKTWSNGKPESLIPFHIQSNNTKAPKNIPPTPILKPTVIPKPIPEPIPIPISTPIPTPIPTPTPPLSSIPVPPPLPPTPPNTCKETTPINDEMLKEGKKNLKLVNTEINIHTTCDTISDDKLIEELKRRYMVKDDNEFKSEVTVRTENNENLIIGKNRQPMKLTTFGHAYLFPYNKDENTEHDLPPGPPNTIVFKLGVLKEPENVFLLHGRQTHILAIVIDPKDDTKCYGLFALTSKKSENILSTIQYEKFEKIQENNMQQSHNNKVQYITPFSNLLKIPKDQITFLKWGSKYLDEVEFQDNIVDIYLQLQAKKAVIFNNIGPLKENFINICKQYDDNVNKKNKHPQTKSQIEAHQEAKEKQQQQQEIKKKEKYDNKNKEEIIKNNDEKNINNDE